MIYTREREKEEPSNLVWAMSSGYLMANVVSPEAAPATVLSHRNRLRLGGTVDM